MDIKQIQELIKFVAKSGVNEVAIEKADFKITIKANQSPLLAPSHIPSVNRTPLETITPPPTAATAAETLTSREQPVEAPSNITIIKSPMIGTFYQSAAPDKPSFVQVGDEVRAGDVICIIEAMKLFNEVESEISGRIVKVLVENASPVEYDQPLFMVELPAQTES